MSIRTSQLRLYLAAGRMADATQGSAAHHEAVADVITAFDELSSKTTNPTNRKAEK